MNSKRRATSPSDQVENEIAGRPLKRQRVFSTHNPDPVHEHGAESEEQAVEARKHDSQRDIISCVSDEILLRVLSYFSPRQLLQISTTSVYFRRLTSDSQLWRPHFYRKFILPRARMIPGFRDSLATGKGSDAKLRFEGNTSIWADGGYGRRGGGLVENSLLQKKPSTLGSSWKSGTIDSTAVDWRQAYKLRHNWEQGRCAAAEEMPLYDEKGTSSSYKTFARLIEGLAVTVDVYFGVRIWDLKTRTLLAHKDVKEFELENGTLNEPTCLALDGSTTTIGTIGISVGFEDGTFVVFKFDMESKDLKMLRRYKDAAAGGLVSLAYLYPYIMTATDKGFIVLYTFDYSHASSSGSSETIDSKPAGDHIGDTLPVPYLLNTLRSRDFKPARALSIRKMASSVVASFAWTFEAIGGWCISIQDLDIRPSGRATPDIITSRMASTDPTPSRRAGSWSERWSQRIWWPRNEQSESDTDTEEIDDGPVRLCYNHPYLLATMPDNTLLLYLCTATANSLSISQGKRLFGHTSGISDAVITKGGKAVSVSSRGGEIRLWELEGGLDKGSVEVRPRSRTESTQENDISAKSLEEKKNWVGFDDEMVIVLNEKNDGRESFVVYDFT